MAHDVIINGITYPDVESVSLKNSSGDVFMYYPIPELSAPGASADLMTGKQLINGEGKIVDGTFSLDEELAEQDILISQIVTALQGKTAGGAAVVQPLEITENGTYTAPHGVDGYSPVTVHVPIPDDYIKPSGTLEVTENGEHDVTEYASVNVDIPTGGGDPKELLDAALNNTLTAIDSNVTSIVAYACRGLSKIKTVNLPKATSIGTYAFYYCTSMTRFDAPAVKTLNSYAFYNCSKLTYIIFPLATSIPQNCFYSCGEIVKADFGAAKSIAASAFAYCSAMNALILRRTDAICTLANTTNALKDTPIEKGTGYVYVPAALVETYKTASNWATFAAQIRAIEDYPDICG